MAGHTVNVYMKSEEFKIGWTHGFYDAIADDGTNYRSHKALGYVLSNRRSSPKRIRLYNDGYLAGWTSRLEGDLRRLRQEMRVKDDRTERTRLVLRHEYVDSEASKERAFGAGRRLKVVEQRERRGWLRRGAVRP